MKCQWDPDLALQCDRDQSHHIRDGHPSGADDLSQGSRKHDTKPFEVYKVILFIFLFIF